MDNMELARGLLSGQYAIRSDGVVLSSSGDCDWTGVKKICGDFALRWDGRVLCKKRAGWRHDDEDVVSWRGIRDLVVLDDCIVASREDGSLQVELNYYTHMTNQEVFAVCWPGVQQLTITKNLSTWKGLRENYLIGLWPDGRAEVLNMGNTTSHSSEISKMLADFGPVKKVSGDYRALSFDGRVLDFTPGKGGSIAKGRFTDFDIPADGNIVMRSGDCVLKTNGTVLVPEDRYNAAAEWRDIIAISNYSYSGILLGLESGGGVKLAAKFDYDRDCLQVDASDWKLFGSLDTLADELEQTRLRTIEEGKLLDVEDAEKALAEKIAKLHSRRKEALGDIEWGKKELLAANGIFKRKRRKDMLAYLLRAEDRFREAEIELHKLEG